MTDPKPISVVYVDPAEYAGPAPQPFAVIGQEPGGDTGPIAIDDVEGLESALDAKADSDSIPSEPSDIGAAPASHTHPIAQVQGLQSILDDLEARVAALEEPED